MTPFASSNARHRPIKTPPPSGLVYYAAHKSYADEPADFEYLGWKWLYASWATKATVDGGSDYRKDVTVTIDYKAPFHMPAIGRIFGSPSLVRLLHHQHSHRRQTRKPSPSQRRKESFVASFRNQLCAGREITFWPSWQTTTARRAPTLVRCMRPSRAFSASSPASPCCSWHCSSRLVFNVGGAVKQKVELQNAADASILSSSSMTARGMNAITLTNHMLGELTALMVLHEALGGTELDDNVANGDKRQSSASFHAPQHVAHDAAPAQQQLRTARTR